VLVRRKIEKRQKQLKLTKIEKQSLKTIVMIGKPNVRKKKKKTKI